MKIKDEIKDTREKQWGAAGRLYQQTHLDNGNLATNVSNKNENKVKHRHRRNVTSHHSLSLL